MTLSVLDTPGGGKSQKNAGSRGQRPRNGDSGRPRSGQKRKNGDEGAEKQASSRDQSDPPRDIKGVP
ncbi:MAG: hypothetical protein MK036_07020, partial [Dehalococcoidia bacterium]|nr:hypothetical protein [Dehalococcoidia bacterium]